MPVTFVTGNIFNDSADAITNPVNLVGVMGAGLALAFKQRHPKMFYEYRALLVDGHLAAGKPALSRRDSRPILLFPTKRHWREPSRLEDISAGLDCVADNTLFWDLRSLAIPPLGCGLGGLAIADVEAAVHDAFVDHPLDLRFYRPN